MTGAVRGVAQARAALAGNPSDLYGGAVLAVTLPAWRASARVSPAQGLRVDPPSDLVAAAVGRFHHQLSAPAASVRVDWHSTIPRAVGLGGSSALVIATLRGLLKYHRVVLPPAELADLALAVETEDLAIAAGPQDRLAQAHEGLTFMDFSRPRATCEKLAGRLPPLLIAWRQSARSFSGDVHASTARDPTAVPGLAAAARTARDALIAGDPAGFAAAVDLSLEMRGRLMELDPPTLEMARAVRRAGAAANYAGSGGAIVAVAVGSEPLEVAAGYLRALGCSVHHQGWDRPHMTGPGIPVGRNPKKATG